MRRAVLVAHAVGFLAARLTPAAFVLVVAGWRFALAFLGGQLVSGAGWRLRAPRPSLTRALDALLWCSGHPDFGEGGRARAGWLRVVEPVVEQLRREGM